MAYLGHEGRPAESGRRVIVVGDIINDILVRPLSAVTTDSDTRAEIIRRPGGSAANLACWLGSLGSPVSFVGRVGHADHAYHCEYLTRFGVDARLAVDWDRETGTIVIIVDADGGRLERFEVGDPKTRE